MAKAKKLPSGSWRCLVYSHTEKVFDKNHRTVIDSKTNKQKERRVYESFTCDDPSPAGKREAEKQASIFAASKTAEAAAQSSGMTFGEALEAYIKIKTPILSPRTIMDYKCTQRNYIQDLMGIKLQRLTQKDIQNAINLESTHLSPKSVRNIHGLISAVLREYKPDMRLTTTLPKKIRPTLYIPTDQDIHVLIELIKGTDLELPVLLAAFGPMRRGEISALDTSYINGNTVHVHNNMVLDLNKKWIIKSPKSFAGDRFIEYPDFVAEKWKGKKGRITDLTPNAITDRFNRALTKAGLHHFRFHDLRHYSASIQHALGIPDAYIMQRGGWSSDNTLKEIYRHTLDDQSAVMSEKANTHFQMLCNTKYNTKKENPSKH